MLRFALRVLQPLLPEGPPSSGTPAGRPPLLWLGAAPRVCSGSPRWRRPPLVVRTFQTEGQGMGVSPDGRYIVYGDGMKRSLRLLTLATGETRELIAFSPLSWDIVRWGVEWTPDSRSVVFCGRQKGEEGMWLVVGLEAFRDLGKVRPSLTPHPALGHPLPPNGRGTSFQITPADSLALPL